MSELVLILLRQIVIMFLLIAAGAVLYKGKKITANGSREMGTVLLYLVIPFTIINAFMTEYSPEKLVALGYSFVAALVSLVLAMLVSRVLFGSRFRIEHFGTAFSNAGFIGIPLVSAALGSGAVFYVSSFVALLNLFQWTYGVMVMTGKKDAISLKAVVKNPILISLVVGVAIFLLRIPVPAILSQTVGMVANLNAPLAMLVLGVYMAQIRFVELVTDKISYAASAVRLLLIPLLTIGVLSLFGNVATEIRLAVLLAAAAPIGSNVAIFAQQNDLSYTQAVKGVCLSTALSIITMPVILWLAMSIW